MRQSFRQSVRRFRGESVQSDGGGQPQQQQQPEAHLRGRHSRGKVNPDNFSGSPPDYATVIIETERHSEYGSFNLHSEDRATSTVSSELTLVDSRSSEVSSPMSTISFHPTTTRSLNRDSIQSQSFRFQSSAASSTASSDLEVTSKKVKTASIVNAEPLDTIQGASAAAVMTSEVTSEMDNAVNEYTMTAEMTLAKNVSDMDFRKLQQQQQSSDTDMDIYSATSTLSLGETVILSDGWLSRPLTSLPNNTASSIQQPNTTATIQHFEDIVMTLDVDTSASVI